MDTYEAILWTLLVLVGLGAAVIHFNRISKSVDHDFKAEMERKKHPLSKIEIARKQALRRAEKEKDNE